MSKGSGTLQRLQNWYASMCNGDWEHTYGIAIGNIDNPGWSVTIDLTDTSLHEVSFNEVKRQGSEEHDWIQCKLESRRFVAHGGPKNLDEMLAVFLDWAEKN